MAECDPLNQRLEEIQARLKDLAAARAAAQSMREMADVPNVGKNIAILKDYLGQEIGVSLEAWIKQGESDMRAMGDRAIQDLVSQGIAGREGPRGSSGRMTNFNQYMVDFKQYPRKLDNVLALLEVIGLQRVETEQGIRLKRSFTRTAAAQAVKRLYREKGGDPESIFQYLTTKARRGGIADLAETTALVAKARWDSISQFADVVDQIASAMVDGAYTDELKMYLGNATQWAHLFEHLDAFYRRKVGQALHSLQFRFDDDFTLVDLDEGLVRELTMEDIKGETLLGQVLKHIEQGDTQKLRQMAATVRTNGLTRTQLNTPRFLSQLHLLNNFRRNNMLTSLSSWAVRNPVGGALVSMYYGMEDVIEGSLRVGVAEEMKAIAHANRFLVDAMQMAAKNAFTFLGTGRAVMGPGAFKLDVSPEILGDEKRAVYDALAASLTVFRDPLYHLKVPVASTAVTTMNLLNAAFSIVFGRIGEKFGWDGGYLPSFRLLGAGDEGIRSMAYALKVNHEAYLQARKELGPKASSEAVAAAAEEKAKRSLFSGQMSDEDLVNFRRKAGIPIGEGMSNDELRLQINNNLAGMPDTTTELGAMGVKRGQEVTFTTTNTNPIMQGLGLTRQNALVAWQLPFFKTPLNALLWSLNRTALPSVFKVMNLPSNATKEEIAQAQAQLILSGVIMALGGAAIQSGAFVGGGPSDREDYKRWRRAGNIPYSFRINGRTIPASRILSSWGGIDPVDLLGIQADVWELAIKDGIGEGDYAQFSYGLLTAGARMLNNKASLLSTATVLNALTQPDRVDIAQVLASSMGGLGPLSGLSGNIDRAMRGPREPTDNRRFITAAEKQALKDADPAYQPLAPILEFLQDVGERVAKPYVGLNQVLKAPVRRDWLGTEIKRPAGIPFDAVIPFAPVIMPKDPLYQWLFDAGVTTKPKPNNRITIGRTPKSATLTMTNEEEAIYREAMRTYVGEVPATAFMHRKPSSFYMDIDRYVQGNTLREALRALKNDPIYQAVVAISENDSPDQRVNPAPFADRRDTSLYSPIQDIIDYYDVAGRLALAAGEGEISDGFRTRYQAMIKANEATLQDKIDRYEELELERRP